MHSFNYIGFVSYRNGKPGSAQEIFVEKFVRALKRSVDEDLEDERIGDERGRNIFFDREIFPNNSDFDLKTLSAGLCKSMVWIVLYTRNYLRASDPSWCASELHGMEVLEGKRLTKLDATGSKDFGFVIPIILRGNEEEMPRFLREKKRHILNMSGFSLRPNVEYDRDFTDQLLQLCVKIGQLQSSLLKKKVDICADCADFLLKDMNSEADKAEIAAYLQPPQPTT
jgi:hypothetical protein